MSGHGGWRAVIATNTRFWLKVWPRGDCWEWRASRRPGGYGSFGVAGKSPVRAHRFAYECAYGPIPSRATSGLVLDHLCQHPWCVRPSHLQLVSQRVNTLRGKAPAALLFKSNTCKHGHPRTEENTRIKPQHGRKSGLQRSCRACNRINAVKRYHAKNPEAPYRQYPKPRHAA